MASRLRPSLALCAPPCALAFALACGPAESGDDDVGTDTGETDSATDTGTDTSADTGTDTGGVELDPECLGDAPIVVIETSMGDLVVQLDAVNAPITVENFLVYVSSDFYPGTIFHRVMDGFVVQGGGVLPDGTLKETLGTIPLEIHPDLRHVDGAIAMARSNDPDSAESQWYLTDGAQPSLDDNYAVFGVLIDGFEVRDAMSAVETGPGVLIIDGMEFEYNERPVEDIVLDDAYCVTSWP